MQDLFPKSTCEPQILGRGEQILGTGAANARVSVMSRAPLYAVIPAGGAGTRLWPLSRRSRPKFLLDLDGSGRSLLQRTWDRLREVTEAERIIVVTGAAHVDAVREQLPDLAEENLLAEPSPRDSMPAIGWAAAQVARRDPDAVVASFAADHLIDDTAAFAEVVTAAHTAAEAGSICTIGIDPTGPATGFGYIEQGDPLDLETTVAVHAVKRFVEKPDRATAEEYLATGRFAWNAGMFVGRASVLLNQLRLEHPRIAEGLETIAADPSRLETVWPTLSAIAIDHAVAEPAAARGVIATVRAGFAWDDIGDFESLARLGAEAQGRDILTIDAPGTYATSTTGRTITVIGVPNAVVVDTGDAVLVTTRDQAQRVKEAVAAWQDRDRDDLT